MNSRLTATSATLNLLGAALVAWWLIAPHGRVLETWAVVLGCVAAAAWALRTTAALRGWRRTAIAAAAAGVLAGALAAAGTDGTSTVPALVCLLVLVSDDTMPLARGVVVGVAAIGMAAVGAVLHPVALLQLITILGAIVLGCLGGYSRRQLRRTQRQEALLAERDIATREEAARVAIARDLHDVLAHTLGGLVIQLDAAEAQLEAGDVASARARVSAARDLAGAGLGEARRAVAALRAPGGPVEAEDVASAALNATFDDLVAAHRALGGEATVTVSGTPQPVSAEEATALERALQEALSNARRHAPGEPVDVRIDWQDDGVELRVSNPVVSSAATGSSGYGLVGMRERFAALSRGGAVTADAAAGRFTITARASLR